MGLIAFAIVFLASLHYQSVVAGIQLKSGRAVSPLADHISSALLAATIVLPLWAFSYFIFGSGGAP